MSLARRLRGIAGLAAAWAVTWSALGILPSVAVQIFWFARHQTEMLSAWRVAVMVANGIPLWGIWGAISGTVFAVLMMLREREGSVGTLSARRIAAWGAFAGLPIPLLSTALMLTHARSLTVVPAVIGVIGVGALLGMACGVGSLALARRAPYGRAPIHVA